MSSGDQALAFRAHDHADCQRGILAAVEEAVVERGLRLTPVRRQTLEILLQSHVALGAYELLDKLSQKGFGEKPPVVYRSLAFLIDEGFVHKLQHQQSYVACTRPGHCVTPCLFVCHCCGRVAETHEDQVQRNLTKTAKRLDFSPNNTVMELGGTCSLCPGDN